MTHRPWLALAALLGACASTPAAPAYTFTPGACDFDVGGSGAVCGTVSAPEDYARPEGRRIDLYVVRIPAIEADAPRAVLIDLEGGPGFGATDNAEGYLTFLAPLRQRRDIVLFDMRGTKNSNALRCSAIEAYRANDRNAPLYPPELVQQCVEQVAAHADRSQYTTANAARDIEAVRQALGYEEIDLSAASYGTTLALAYMSMFPERVRTAALFHTATASAMPPRAHAVGAQRALLMYIDACAAEPACNAAFPDLRGDLERVRAELGDNDPFPFEIFMERLRERMYQPGPARRLPLVIHRAAQGNFDGFMSAPPGGGGRVLSDGLYLSITCAESFPYFDYDEAATRSRAGYFADYRLRRQRDACAVWNVPPSPTPTPRAPLDIPVLFISGDFDPATPPAWTEETRAVFPINRHILMAEGGHGAGGLANVDCLVNVEAAFHDAGNFDGFDDSCIASMRRPPFELE